jgi:hypothetical protein
LGRGHGRLCSRRHCRGGSVRDGSIGRRSRSGCTVGHDSENCPDVHGLAFGNADLRDDTAGRRRDLGVHLVGGDLEERLVAFDRFTNLLEPAGDCSFGHGLAELRHEDVSQRANPFR